MNIRYVRRARAPSIVLLLVVAIVLTETMPSAATSFSDTHTMTYSTDYSYASTLDLCPYGPPCELRIVAESDLRTGYSGSQICVTSGVVDYNTYVTSFYALQANWDLYGDSTVYESVTSGDLRYTVTIYPIQVNDEDADGNPGPMEDYIISFASMRYGRSADISYSYGLAYPTGTCNSDGYSTSTTVQSRGRTGMVQS